MAKVSVIGKGAFGGAQVLTYSIAKAEQKLTADKSRLTMEADTTETLTISGCMTALTFESVDTNIVTVQAAAGSTSAAVTAAARGSTFLIVRAAGNTNYKSAMLTVYKAKQQSTTSIGATAPLWSKAIASQ